MVVVQDVLITYRADFRSTHACTELEQHRQRCQFAAFHSGLKVFPCKRLKLLELIYRVNLRVVGLLPLDPEHAPAVHMDFQHWIRFQDLQIHSGPIVKAFLGVTPSSAQVRDALATVTSHIAIQIARIIERQQIKTLLVTGGGAWNSYLLEIVGKYCPEVQISVPDALIVNYKEALIFALLGYLRLKGKINTLSSVTGAKIDSIGGNISGKMKNEK